MNVQHLVDATRTLLADAEELAAHPRETISDGRNRLHGRRNECFQMGARFAKRRAAIFVGECLPSRG